MNKISYKPQKEEISATPRAGGRFLRETDARILIDRQLRQAGWNIEDKNQVATEETSQTGRADYILKDSRSRAMAVVEAKRFSVDPASAKQQALAYAESINASFIFLSNSSGR